MHYLCLSRQGRGEDRLLQLPGELLRRITSILCSDTDSALSNQSMLALRLASKGTKAASDATRVRIKLHSHHLEDAIPYLSKLTCLPAVTICASRDDNPTLSDLSPLSNLFPHLTSLTLDPGSNEYVILQDMSELLLPWKHSLRHLKLVRCGLTRTFNRRSQTDLDGESVSIQLLSWAPDLPLLSTLLMEFVPLVALELACCPALHTLGLSDCTHLVTIKGLADLEAFHTMRLQCLLRLSNLDMVDCKTLAHLRITMTKDLTSLDLSGCSTLQVLELILNFDLASVNLIGCSSLEELTISSNQSLGRLDMSHNAQLKLFICTHNCKLTAVDLSRCDALEVCCLESNKALWKLHLSGLQALQTVICLDHIALTSVDLMGCQKLGSLRCDDNNVLANLDVSGCAALLSLWMNNNPNLVSLNVGGCGKLLLLKTLGCGSLRKVDTTSCIALMDVKGRNVRKEVSVLTDFEVGCTVMQRLSMLGFG